MERHDRLVNLLSDIIEDATGLPAMTEQHSAVHDDDRHPDLVFQNWRGETQWVDVAVTSPYARIQGNPRHVRAGTAIAVMEGVERRKYQRLALIPAVCTQLGRAGQDLVTLFRSLSRDADPLARSEAVSSMWKQWSCMLHKWNCHILAKAGPLIGP